MDELLLLVYACVLGLVAFVPATARRALVNGLLPLTKYVTGTRELNVSNRVRAAHKNLTAENLTPFIGIALSAHGLGVVGLAGPAAVFCCGRLVHFFGAILNPPFARTLGFVAGWAASMYVAYLVYGAYSALEAPSEGEKTFALITATCVFTLLLFVPYDLGRIPANGILKLTYYNDIVESDWLVRGKAAHLNMAKENLPPFVGIFLVAARLQSFDQLAVQGAPQLALYFLAARCFHYLAAYVNIPFARTVGFVAGWAVCMCCAYLVALELLNMDNLDAGWLNLEMLSAISVFTLLLFIPYDLGRIPANGILKLTYYNKEMVESGWIQRAKAAHLHMAGLVLAADSLRVQEDLHLPYILGFRAAHYFVVWCNPPLLRTAFFAAAWMLMLRIAYLTIQAAGEDATMQSLVGAGILVAATACTFVDNSVAPDGGSSEETQEKLEEKLLSLS